MKHVLLLLFPSVLFVVGCDSVAQKERSVSSHAATDNAKGNDTPPLSVSGKDDSVVAEKARRFLDAFIDSKHSHEYRDAVEKVYLTQLDFCDGTGKPERTVCQTKKEPNGETVVSFRSPGRSDEGDVYDDAMRLSNGNVTGLAWYMETAIDSCPCMSPETPTCLNDLLLEQIARITTLEKIDLAGGFITDGGLKKLASLKRLKSLLFNENRNVIYYPENQPKLTYNAFDSLHGLVDLEELVTTHKILEPNSNSKPLFNALPHYPKLRSLSAIGLEFNRKNIEAMVSCRNLTSLEIDGTMTEPCLDLFEKLEQLQTLKLTIRTNGLPVVIPPLPKLTVLNLSIYAEKEQEVVVSGLPVLQNVSVSLHTIENQIELDNLPELTSIRLAQENTRSIKVRFENLPKVLQCEWLQCDLAVTKTSQEPWDRPFRFTQNNMDATLRLPRLQSLEILGPLAEGVDLRELAALEHLNNLQLRAMEVNDPELCSVLRTKSLTLYCCRLPDPLRLENLPFLKELTMYYCIGKSILIKDAPMLNKMTYHTWNWEIKTDLESIVFENCPELSILNADRKSIRHLDIKGTKLGEKMYSKP